jgi:hypothetical protein
MNANVTTNSASRPLPLSPEEKAAQEAIGVKFGTGEPLRDPSLCHSGHDGSPS